MADSGNHFKVGSRKSQVVITAISTVISNIDFGDSTSFRSERVSDNLPNECSFIFVCK